MSFFLLIFDAMKANFNFNLEDIDGVQIIEFIKNNDDRSVEFIENSLSKDYYSLRFSKDWNNWGHISTCKHNYLYLFKDKIEVSLDEPWEGNGDDEELEIKLKNWLENYIFEKINYKEKLNKLLFEVVEKIDNKLGGDIQTGEIDELINKLKEAKTYIK